MPFEKVILLDQVFELLIFVQLSVSGLELALSSSLVFHKKMSTSKFMFEEDLKV